MAINVTYDPATNRITVTGGTESVPANFDDIVTFDRAGTLKLLDGIIDADPDTFSLDRQVRPVELRALQLSITCTARAGATVDIAGKDAWGNAISENGIDVSSGSATTTKYFSEVDANGITVHGLQVDDEFDIDQSQWGVIWDLEQDTYHLDALLCLGDGTTPTYFKDIEKVIIFTDRIRIYGNIDPFTVTDLIYLFANSHIQLGELIDETTKETCKGCVLQTAVAISQCYLLIGSGTNTYRRLYSCSIARSDFYSTTLFIVGSHQTRFWNCNFDSAYPYAVGAIDLYRCTKTQSPSGGLGIWAYSTTPPTIEDYTVYNAYIAAYVYPTYGVVTLRKLKATSTYGVYVYITFAYDVILVDCELENWIMFLTGVTRPGKVLRKYSVNIHVADKNGIDLGGATVICKDKNDDEVLSVQTDENGNIAEQEVTYQQWYQLPTGWHGEDEAECFSPHKFIISKTGYETLELEEIVVDTPIDWHLELQDPVVECDYPVEGDVEEGVEYDSGAKIGNFAVPAEAEVKKDTGYGALGIEFLGILEAGEMMLLRGVNLEAQLEKDTNLSAQLEKRTNMVGIMREVEAEG